MKRRSIILLLLIVFVLPSAVHGIGLKKFVTGTAAVEKFCDSSAATGAGLCHDFEKERVLHTPSSDCALSRAYGSLNALGEIGYVVGNPVCANASSPLAGSYDMKISDDAGADTVSWYPLNGAGDTPVCANDETCVIKTLINIPTDAGAGPANARLISFMEGTGFSSLCGVHYDGAEDNLRTHCDGDIEDMTYVLTNGTTYKLCVKYLLTDDCVVYLDPEDGVWCIGEHDSGSGLNCNAGVHDAVDYVEFADGNDTATVQYDNVIVTAE